jgi:hypothetical protein
MYQDKKWFKDDRLRQIRQVKNPHNFMDYYKVEWDKTQLIRQETFENYLMTEK